MTSQALPDPGWRRIGWCLGLPVLGLLWFGAHGIAAPGVIDSLVREGGRILNDTRAVDGEPWLRLEIDGRDVTALGEAPDAQARSAAMTRLATLPGARVLIDRTGLIEPVSPFDWTVTRLAPDRFEGSGHRPAEIGAQAFAQSLAPILPKGAHWQERAKAASGAPSGFSTIAAYAIERLRGLEPGAIARLTDTLLTIEGAALDPDAYEAARNGLPAPPQGFRLGAVTIAAPRVADFRFGIERRGNGAITLTGYAISEEVRADIRKAAEAAAEGASVTDALRTARGLPEEVDPAALTGFALRLAGLLHEGRVSFENGAVSVAGHALDPEAIEDARTLLRDGRPAGIGAGTVSLEAGPVSPYVVRILRQDGRFTLTGHVPDEAARNALLASLRPLVFREPILDRLRYSKGAPAGLGQVLTAAVGPLAGLAQGEIALSDSSLKLSGESLYPESAARLPEAVKRALPPGWSAEVAVTARDAVATYDGQTCAKLFAERTGQPLRFAAGSSALRAEFYPVLDGLAALAKSCPAERIEVTGHTDAPGTSAPKPTPLPEAAAVKASAKGDKSKKDAAKKSDKKPDADAPAAEPPLDLPSARALAIVEYLQRAGVAADRAIPAANATPLSEKQGVGLALRS